MFSKHPNGLIAAALANMGERFGFYIMMAILTLFISAKFGLSETTTGYIYSAFYASIYILALAGGIIADKTKNFKGTILAGLVMMAVGYLIIAIPTPTPVPSMGLYLGLTCFGLLVIAFGNGLFKGNLQALVGQMYDDPKYSSLRDSGFQIFYMFINIGGFFAPWIAIGVRNWWLKVNNFDYDATLPELCHQFLKEGDKMAPQAMENLTALADKVTLDGSHVADMGAFVNNYLDVFNGCHCCHVDFIGNLPGQQEPLPRPGKEGCSCQGTECYRKQRRNQDERSRNQTAYLCLVRSVRCGNLLLAVVPPERLFADLLCTRLCRLERNRY